MWRKILKNTTWLASSQLIGRALRAGIVIYAARILGPASWGAFSYALGITAFLTIFSDIGIGALIVREGARNAVLGKQYIATALLIKLIFIALFSIGTALLLPYISNIAEARALMPILIAVFIFDTLRDLGSAVSRAKEQMEIEGGVTIATNAIIMVLGIIFLTYYPGSVALSFAYAIGSGFGLLMMAYLIREHAHELMSHIKPALIPVMLKTAWPFGLMGLVGAIMLNSDIIIIGWLRDATNVGYYSAAQKIIAILYAMPGAFASSIFPVTARMVSDDPTRAKKIVETAVALTIVVAIPITIIGGIFASPIINTLYGNAYAGGVATLQLLLVSLLIIFPSVVMGNTLFAYNKERGLLPFIALQTIGNIIFDLVLIPYYGIEGAAIGTIVTQLIANSWLLYKIKQINHMSVTAGIKSLVVSVSQYLLKNRTTI